MTSQDDVAVLRGMRDRGEITDEEYTAFRRYVLWGTPLPPELAGRVLPASLRREPEQSPQVRRPRPAERGAPPEPYAGPRRQPPPFEPPRGEPPPLRRAGTGPDEWTSPPRLPDRRTDPPRRDPRHDPRHEPRRDPRREPRPPDPGHRDGTHPDPRDYPPPARTEIVRRAEVLARPPADRGRLPDRREPDGGHDGGGRPTRRPGTDLEPARRVERVPERREAAVEPARPGRAATRGEREAAARAALPVKATSVRLPMATGRATPARRRRQVTLLVSAALVLALVAAGVWRFALQTSPVQPDMYAHRVCTTVSGWQQSIADARQTLVTALGGNRDLRVARNALVSFYQDAEQRTATLSVELSEIGPPNVPGGEDYARELRDAVASSATEFHDEAARAGEIDTSSSAAFGPALQARLSAIDAKALPVLDALSGRGFEPPLDLRTAFDSEPTCAAYTG